MKRPQVVAAIALVSWLVAIAGAGFAAQAQKSAPDILAPYVPSPPDVVDRMLAFAKVTAKDVVYDLGCGDGRIVIAAARTYGAKGVGVDIDPALVEEAKANAKNAGVERLVTFRVEDALTTDVSEATVVTLYLFGAGNLKLRPRLTAQLKPGARIVSHNFMLGDWPPIDNLHFRDADGFTRDLYLWRADGTVRR